MTRINKEMSKQIKLMREQGFSTQAIKRHLASLGIDVTMRTVRLHFKEKKPGRPRPRKLQFDIMTVIDEETKANDLTSSKDLKQKIEADFGVQLGLTTICRARRQLGWKYGKHKKKARASFYKSGKQRLAAKKNCIPPTMSPKWPLKSTEPAPVALSEREGEVKNKVTSTTSGFLPKGDTCEAAPRCDTEDRSMEDRLLDTERKLSEVKLKLCTAESQVAALSIAIEALTKRLSAVEAQQNSEQTPPEAQEHLDASPLSKQRLHVLGSAASATPACPNSPSPTPTPAPLEDVSLRAISAEREETFYRDSFVSGTPRPEIYAASLFMALTPFEVYGTWVMRTNWSGTNGKVAIPDNIKERIHGYVAQRFPGLTGKHWHKIRGRINERLRCPRKVDPETPQLGFCRR